MLAHNLPATKPEPGLFIVIDGIDGAGKTTLAERLASLFQCAGEPCVRSKEPTDGPWGQTIRGWAQTGRPTPDEEIEAFVADRAEHVRDVIGPAIAAGKIVLLDRYFYSTIAYQSAGDSSRFATIRDRVTQGVPTPDVTIILDTLPELGLHRITEKRGDKPNAFERLEDLRAVRAMFRQMASMPNLAIFDATPPADAVAREVARHLLDGVLKERYCAKPWGCDGMLCVPRITGECRWAELRR